jgi:monoamine oxidase
MAASGALLCGGIMPVRLAKARVASGLRNGDNRRMTDRAPTFRYTCDIAVIGAGAAGVAAARAVQGARPDLALVVLEASDRIGGRAHTVTSPDIAGGALDLGCGWLHGARTNEWTRIAGELGLTVDRTPAPWSEGGRRLNVGSEEESESQQALAEFYARAEQRAALGTDGTLAEALEPGNPWNARIGAIATFINGVELDQASLLDLDRYEPGPGPDWRVREGLGALVVRYGAPLPVALNTAVTSIDHRPRDHIAITTSRGTIRAQAVIVTVSTNMLAAEAIRFDPPLPRKVEAAARLPLGLANKAFLLVRDAQDLPVDTRVMGAPSRTASGGYQLRPFGLPVIEAYFGGQLARHLETEGEAAVLAFATEELASRLGAGMRDRLSLVAMSAWAGTAHIGGSYSYARPGAADERAVLAAPVDGRLFFAGEACALARFSTAHGAYESGVIAAHDALAALESKRR